MVGDASSLEAEQRRVLHAPRLARALSWLIAILKEGQTSWLMRYMFSLSVQFINQFAPIKSDRKWF